ncbi:MAG TPA: winged helix-turn-helix domain-containing protein [Dokdonella sp.]|uniref:winged helix-turn-helix domain-containing protein n=1 Tax=Dokdonella sp. TaxID=2291710 RepID=UPI002C407153|nr:winged helix-turn-helix domain-containing protein [Dokdonella sp.]HUD41448.1 winged helix-turn-helix domain-containing protein [Dokdonella sp.]
MPAPIYAFGRFRLDVDARLLYRDGEAIPLPTRLFDCIVHLLEHRARAVGRDELIAVIWERPDSGDNLLGQLVVRARRLLEDTGEQQRVIRTLPGYGYQWIAPTRCLDGAPGAAPSPAGTASASAAADAEGDPGGGAHACDRAAPAPRRSRRVAAGLAVALAVAAAAGVWWPRAAPQPLPAAAAPRPAAADRDETIAQARPLLVLPAALEAGPDEAWLRLGVMALVGERLADAGQIVVPSDDVATLTRGLAVAAFDASDYARLAGVTRAERVIAVAIERSGSRWRVRLAVVHGAAPLEVAAEAGQVLDAARDAADRLASHLPPARAPASQPLAGGDAALDFVLKKAEAIHLGGRPDAAADLLADARATRPDAPGLDLRLAWMAFRAGRFEQAEAGFAALAKDRPDWRARALIGLANVALVRRDTDAVMERAQQAIDLLEAAGGAAGELGSAYHGRAVAASLQGRYEAAFADYARARELHAGAGNWLDAARVDSNFGIALRQRGLIEQALPRLQRTADRLSLFQATDDESVARVHLVTTLLDLADPVSALAEDGRLAALAGRSQWPQLQTSLDLARAEVLIANGRLRAAAPLLDRATREAAAGPLPNTYRAHSIAARQAWALGDTEQARQAIGRALGVLCSGDVCATGDGRDLAHLHLLLARSALPADPSAAAAVRAQLARRLAGHAYAEVYLSLIDADVAVARGDAAAADRAFEAAAGVAEAIPIDRERIAEAYVPWLMAHGAIDRAGGVLATLDAMPRRSFVAALIELRVLRAQGRHSAWRLSLDRAIRLAGEREIPEELRRPDFLAASAAAP